MFTLEMSADFRRGQLDLCFLKNPSQKKKRFFRFSDFTIASSVFFKCWNFQKRSPYSSLILSLTFSSMNCPVWESVLPEALYISLVSSWTLPTSSSSCFTTRTICMLVQGPLLVFAMTINAISDKDNSRANDIYGIKRIFRNIAAGSAQYWNTIF